MSARIVHLLRHAAVERPGRFLGRSDEPCTGAGLATCLDRAAEVEFDTIVTSPLIRAAEVADALGALRRLPVAQDAAWLELDFGTWEGKTADEIGEEALLPFYGQPDRHAPPGGERWNTLVRRVAGAIDRLGEGSSLVVTHGGPIRAALAHLCGFDPRQLWAFDLPYGALLSLRLFPGDPVSAQITALHT
ncbi:histidine phosphatase family protein [Sphingosinicella sp. BN140058]|uniref:histidine phosphatase family protein n=1 Tax=Sphingosinicella sp. BN140058 TaxID=1892855 RepID=UPI00101124D4|nr:histidine phosphatase family protein [Sphingosinicella sp. BN140058]QAY77518.1 histidine phosphatase family protein [Sphingosinicella sp. BN140058]